MDTVTLKQWRRAERERLIGLRLALDGPALMGLRQRIDHNLAHAFPGLAEITFAFCWPIRNEYDARHFARAMRDKGAVTVLPVVVAPKSALAFREWRPGFAMARGALSIPYPTDSADIRPRAVLLPMNGWDDAGFRLGYGGGFFDRTLAEFGQEPGAAPSVIGIAYEQARLDTIYPQPWDIPVDYVVTERGIYRRDAAGLVFLGTPDGGSASALASPVCYAGELAPGYFGEST